MFLVEPQDNEWPAEMSITVASGEIHLLELLWIRHHVHLQVDPRLPSADLPDVASTGVDWTQHESAWAAAWDRALIFSAQVHLTEPKSIALKPDLWETPHPLGLARLAGVSLSGAQEWKKRLRSQHLDGLDRSSEMLGAWRRGLRLIIELPLRGDYGRQYDNQVLLVSHALHSNERKYETLLSSFR